MDDYPKTQPIIALVKEARNYYTLFLENRLHEYTPGQFVMLWIPRVDEKPFSLSYVERQRIGITFEVKGRFTKILAEMKAGELVGVRGPYGKGFPPLDRTTVIVGGGCGIAPLAPLVERAAHAIIGARTRDVLLFSERFRDALFCTDDGSFGKKGFVTEHLAALLRKEKDITAVYSCGPEIMLKRLMAICSEYRKECYVSIERYMKCGFGVCGQCMCGDVVVCKDGPVLNARELEQNADFGTSARLKSGRRVPLAEYYSYRT